jgi:hypothetical protein
MSTWRPSPAEERWLAAGARARIDSKSPWLIERTGGWRGVRLLPRCAFFLLGVFAATTAVGMMSLMRVPGYLIVAGISLIVAGEWLTTQRRVFAAGIEEALTVVGLLVITFDVFDSGFRSNEIVMSIVMAAAFAAAGLRLLNPLFTTLGAAALSVTVMYAGSSDKLGSWSAGLRPSVYCFAVGGCALALGARQLERPSVDRMLDWLVVAMPVGGYLWAATAHLNFWSAQSGMAYFHDHPFGALWNLLAPAIFGVVALAVGCRRRRHAPLLAFMGCCLCVAVELHELGNWALQTRLILGGSATFAVALAVNRWLRTPRRGITSQQAGATSGVFDLVQLAGAASLSPQSGAASAPEFKPGGGSFGGGGASGRF